MDQGNESFPVFDPKGELFQYAEKLSMQSPRKLQITLPALGGLADSAIRSGNIRAFAELALEIVAGLTEQNQSLTAALEKRTLGIEEPTQTTTFFLDCEFNEQDGQLLSMALVPLDSELGIGEFYEELVVMEPLRDWVREHLPHWKDNRLAIDRATFGTRLEAYLSAFPAVTIIADWPDDLKYFSDMLIRTPGVRIAPNTELVLKIDRRLTADQSEVPHHALHDARALRNAYLRTLKPAPL